MKKFTFTALVPLLLACMIHTASAEDKATRQECVKMAKAAGEMLLKKGQEATFEKINDPSGPFVWKDTYVFCMTIESGTMKAHPLKPRLIGKNLKGIKDMNGVMFVLDYINKANTHGEGWTDYMWPKPGEKKPSNKTTYTYKVPGMDYMMAAGIYQ